MTNDVFESVRRMISTREVAAVYGFQPNRHGYIACPLHHEKTPSLRLYQNGTWHCFGCGKGGSSIDFTAELFSLTPLEAVKRLNTDFSLGLGLNKPPDKAAVAAAQRRQEVRQAYELFEEWKDDMIRRLNTCFRLAHLTMKAIQTPADFDRLTDAQALAIQWQATIEYWADCLLSGDMAVQMDIFRDRKGVDALCGMILQSSQTKSGAA